MPTSLPSAPCAVCRSPLEELGHRQGYVYAACRACGGVQLTPMPSAEELARLYREAYHNAGHSDLSPEQNLAHRRNIFEFVARRARALHPPDDPRLVVELGAGWGGFGVVARELGLPYLGLEPSETMSAHAQASGLHVLRGGLDALESESGVQGRIRAFVALAVYEHLPEQLDALRRMSRLLPPDGAILLQGPTAGFPRFCGHIHRTVNRLFFHGRSPLPRLFDFFTPPWHVSFPSPASVRLQASECGLELRGVEASPSGRQPGLHGWLQRTQEWIAFAGFRLAGERWPLCMSHVFVLRSPDWTGIRSSG